MDTVDMVKLKVSSKIGKKAPVLLADFSCGRLNNQNIKFDCFKSETDSSKENRTAKRILMADTGYLSHSGCSKDNQNAPIRYLIGVRHKTGKMKLYDSTIFHLKPNLPETPLHPPEITIAENTYWEGRNKLTEAFGAKVSKRALNTRLKLAVNDNSLKEEDLENSLVSKPVENLPTEFGQTLSYLPHINRDASCLEEVFDINEIISYEEQLSLQDQVEEWLHQYTVDPNAAKQAFCKFVDSSIDNYIDESDKLKRLLYYNYMQIFRNLKANEIRKKDPSPLIPEPFKTCLLRKFTIVSKEVSGKQMRSFPPQMKDKLLAYMIVLALFIEDYSINANLLLNDMTKVSIKHFSDVAQTLGCYMSTQKIEGDTIKLAQLRLPLNFIAPKFTKRQF